MINPPRSQDNYADRDIDCEGALEPMFQLLMADALSHGWSPAEVRKALRKLVAAHKITDIENAKVETTLALIRAAARTGN
jgi:hypothetical protein